MEDLIPEEDLELVALTKRGLTQKTVEKWEYYVCHSYDDVCQVATYRDADGLICAQKLRFKGKDFKTKGNFKEAVLFGQHLWKDRGKMVVITEGEIDAMSVSQLQDHKWPVVSIKNGAQGAKKALKQSLEWLEGFDEIILMFDMDEPGQTAAKECSELFKPGKCKIATLPLKDANDMLLAGRGAEVIQAIWNAKINRPDGILQGADLWDLVSEEDDQFSLSYPWVGLNNITYGFRLGDVVVVSAGTGVGKSAFITEITYHLGNHHQQNVGLLKLEEPIKRTSLGLMGLHVNLPLHIRRPGDNPPDRTILEKAFGGTLGTGRYYLYDHFGSSDPDTLLAKIRYLAKGCDCRYIFLDHLSIVISGQEDGDERRMIDNLMTSLKTLAVECDCVIFVVSHLKRPQGTSHEEGGSTSLSQLRGSHSIAQLADQAIGLERDQQSDDFKDYTTVRVLKNRYTGDTGIAGWLHYDKATGRLTEIKDNPFDRDDSGPSAFGSTDF